MRNTKNTIKISKAKLILAFALILVLIAIAWNRTLLHYGWKQLNGQLEVIMNTAPVDDALLDPNFPDSLKNKLALTKRIREFAVAEIGLAQTDNYSTVYDQKGRDLLWNVSACEPFKLVPYEWNFPFLGAMPYKGFFDLEDAKKERDQLKALGYDTRIRAVGGWSTLGILSDPILSKMLERGEGQLAEVIFHELTHATLFVKGEVTFNENLASFIGERAAIQFLSAEFGLASEPLRIYQIELQDEKKFIHHILAGTKQLDSLYKSMPDTLAISIKDTLKQTLIKRIATSFDTISFESPRYAGLFAQALPNNAYFMSFSRYHSQEDTLQQLYAQSHYDLKTMIETLKKQHGK